MSLFILNGLICALGAFAVLYILITKRVNTQHWLRLFCVCAFGLGFTVWFISGMVNKPYIRMENIVGRGSMLIALLFYYAEMWVNDRPKTKEDVNNGQKTN